MLAIGNKPFQFFCDHKLFFSEGGGGGEGSEIKGTLQ